jgi:hypothetical protein
MAGTRGVANVQIETTGETLTGQGGFLGFLEYLRATKIAEIVRSFLPAPGNHRGYCPSVFVGTLLVLFVLGGRRLSDLREVEREKAILSLLGLTEIPNEDTVGDWLRRMGDPQTGGEGLSGLRKVVDTVNRKMLRRDRSKEYTLDIDASFVKAAKKKAAYSYLNEKGYMPMMAALAELGLFVDDEFREGNVSPQDGHIAVYRRAKAMVESAGKKIARFRADSASYRADLINVLEEDRVLFTITADQDRAVKKLIEEISEKDWKVLGDDPDVCVAEVIHTMAETKKAFRLLVKRTRDRSTPLSGLMKTYRYWAVATNFPPDTTTVRAMEWHQLRGGFENFLKGLKSDVGVGYMPTGESFSNAVFFRIGVLAYNLIIGFKRDLLPVACDSWTLPTLRWKLFGMPGKIVRHARGLTLKLAVSAKDLAFLSGIRMRCLQLCASG